MGKKIRVAQFGIGVIGRGVTRALVKKEGMEIVGAIDISNVGRDLGDIAGVGKKLGVTISPEVNKVLRKGNAQVAIHTTSSSLEKVFPELERLVKAKVNVVSSCPNHKNHNISKP